MMKAFFRLFLFIVSFSLLAFPIGQAYAELDLPSPVGVYNYLYDSVFADKKDKERKTGYAQESKLETPQKAPVAPVSQKLSSLEDPSLIISNDYFLPVTPDKPDNMNKKTKSVAPVYQGTRVDVHPPVIEKPFSNVAEPIMLTNVISANNRYSSPEALNTIEPAAGLNVMASSSADGRRFRALRGANLAEVLDVWAEDSAVEMIWLVERNFSVMESVSTRDSFEQAVLAVLDQYKNRSARPVAQLNTDPVTMKKTLIVRMNGS